MALTFVEQPGDIALSKNPMIWKVNTDDLFVSPGVRRPNFTISFDIIMQKVIPGGPFVNVVSVDAVPDDNGDAYFDISSIMDAELIDSFLTPLLPTFGSSAPFINESQRNYFVQAGEVYGDPPIEVLNLSSGQKIVICGGVSNNLYSDDNDYLGSIDATNSILTWYPDNKVIAADQAEYISYYHYPIATEVLSLEITTHLKAGGTISTTQALISIDNGQIMTIPIGWDQLGLVTPSEDVKKYDVRVKEGISNYRSPLRTYFLDCTYYECKRDLLYLNAFCMPEILRTKGQWLKSLEVERLFSEKILSPGYSKVNGQRFQYRAEADNTWIARTGFIRADEAEALQELLITNNLFEIDNVVGEYIPSYITSNKFNVTECLQYLHFFEFELKRSMRLRNYNTQSL